MAAGLLVGCDAKKSELVPEDLLTKPQVTYAVRRSATKPLTTMSFDLKRELIKTEAGRAPKVPELPTKETSKEDPVAQRGIAASNMPAADLNFAGNSSQDNADVLGFEVLPPDTTGDVGPNHYIQWVNLVFSVYDKAGTRVFGPAPGNLPWSGFGGPCEANNDGDIIILYDQLADRWVFSQFAIAADGHQCFAISQTPDPLGAYFAYDFVVSPGGVNDYPKIGVWPDGYYGTFNEFIGSFTSAVAIAFERDQMLVGAPAAAVKFAVLASGGDTYFSLQPGHLEGLQTPAAGTPNPFVMAFDDEVWGSGGTPVEDSYKLWQFESDWADPGSSTLTGPFSLPTPDFDAELCGFSRNCVPQPDGAPGLDTLGQFTMYRAAYRQFSGHASMVVTHTVDVDGNSTAGVRWTEIRNPGAAAELHQTGTFAPDDGDHRWMPSAAMDGAGNIALVYTASSTTTYPSVRYAGRLVTDPLGQLGQGETELIAGNDSQTSTSGRWGDYATVSVDETDDCTFWMTQEYFADGKWRTQVGAFSYLTCVSAEIGTISGTVTTSEGDPIVGAKVAAGNLSGTADAQGQYAITVPADTYDVIASAYGYEPQVVTGVEVLDGANVQLDFVLERAPTLTVDGFVYDSTSGWPLYSRIGVQADGAPVDAVFSDPQTGYYWVELLSGVEYTFHVASQVVGYLDEVRPLLPGPGDTLVNFALDVNAGTCVAPGYVRTEELLVSVDFEGVFPPAGWEIQNASTDCDGAGEIPDWTETDPGNRTNLTGGEGQFAVADSDACGSGSTMDAELISPPLDLSSLNSEDGLLIRFNSDYRDLSTSTAFVDVFDGSGWAEALRIETNDRGPKEIEAGSRAGNGRPDARVRFHYVAPGWHWWWQIDNVRIATARCEYVGGGLIVGQVTDENTGMPIAGASISVADGESYSSFATPDDPDVGDGFFVAFLPGAREVTASNGGYGSVDAFVVPQYNGVRELNFALPAGWLVASPEAIVTRVPLGGTVDEALFIENIGGFEAGFSLRAVEGPPMQRPEGPFAPVGRRTSPKKINARTAEYVRVPFDVPEVKALDAGEVIARYGTVVGAWGLGVNKAANDVWVGSVAALPGGDDSLHRTLSDGTITGETIDASYTATFAADLAFNTRTGMLWHVNVGGDNCVYEVDPVAQEATGNSICPAFGTSERGLAYDPVTDTFFAGSWNDGIVKQFDTTGAILRSVNVGLDIAGLAYNAGTQHLFAMTNSATADQQDIYVLDAAADFAVVGAFELSESGVPAFADFAQGALGMDCGGNLWAVNQQTAELYVASSGEPGSCDSGLAWLEIFPDEGIVSAGDVFPVTLAFNGMDRVPGQLEAQLLVTSETPYATPSVQVMFTVAFLDVPADHPDDPYVHALSAAGVSAGCGVGNFCPDEGLTRAQMAVWLIRSMFGPEYRPPLATGLVFDDVSPESYAADYIEDIAERGISLGCGGNNYCPLDILLRKDAAVFVLRAIEGGDYMPPPAEGIFDDVPDDPYRPWIDELARRGIATTCGENLFCPDDDAARSQMAVFLVRAFAMRVFFP